MRTMTEEEYDRATEYSNTIYRIAKLLHCEINGIENEVQRLLDKANAQARRERIAEALKR